MDFTLKIWRQKNATDKGKFVTYKVNGITAGTSFLEMLDVLNEELIAKGEERWAGIKRTMIGSG